MTMEQDRLWVERARRDPAAFAHLYDAYFPKVYAYVRHRVRRRQDAEDLVAETFLQAVGALDRFEWRHEASFAGWLFRIAHNLLANFYRRQARQAVAPLEDTADRSSDDPSPDDIASSRKPSPRCTSTSARSRPGAGRSSRSASSAGCGTARSPRSSTLTSGPSPRT